jgi:hypothetical protein
MIGYEAISTKESYQMGVESGMFWEYFPELSGDWEKDKEIILKTL